jgi:hypothetical protein
VPISGGLCSGCFDGSLTGFRPRLHASVERWSIAPLKAGSHFRAPGASSAPRVHALVAVQGPILHSVFSRFVTWSVLAMVVGPQPYTGPEPPTALGCPTFLPPFAARLPMRVVSLRTMGVW